MKTERDKATLETIRAAQQGCEASLSNLTEEVKGKVSALLLRMTLDYHLTDDLTQETIVELIRSLGRLEIHSLKSFWAWVYRTAVGKLQHHNRIQGNKRVDRKARSAREFLSNVISADPGPLRRVIQKEDIATVLGAMCHLKTEYRGVLSLRCIDGMSYAEIASIMGGSPLRVRMLYRHAKGSLQRQLTRRGLGRSHFLPALTVFAALTACPSEKAWAGTVAVEALHAGAQATTNTTGLAKIIAAICAGVALVGITTVVSISGDRSSPAVPPPPRYDDSIRQIYDNPASGYTRQTQILRTTNPDGGDWQCFPWLDRPRPALTIRAVEDRPPGTFLVLPENHSVEYLLSGPLTDRPGVDMAIQVWAWGKLPEMLLTDGSGREHRLVPTAYRGQYPHGFMALAFDLAQTGPPLEPKTLRLVGVESTGPYGGCGIGSIAARTADEPTS
jgi:RNA polymerase sigma-70 factor, ECF subfamily